jgi:peptide-methionine (S)-S-oxide reductase
MPPRAESKIFVRSVYLCITLLCSLSAFGASQTADETPRRATATFAGGCFWCMQPPFDALDGVISTTAGYTGGHTVDPTYEEVSSGSTGHAESVQIVYDPTVVGYERLLDVFWHNVDPLDDGGQFCDRGNQYRTAIFYHTDEQRRLAEASKRALQKQLSGKIATQIVEAGVFYPAEEYHQEYYKKHPIRYHFYRFTCGRDQRLRELYPDRSGE